MALPTTRGRSRVLTASASKLGEARSDGAVRQRMNWQTRALEYVTLIPELSYASLFYARMLKLMRIFPAFLEPDGTLTRIDDPLAVRTLNRIRDPGGGISGILGNYGRLMMSTGEGVLFGTDLDTEDEAWRFLWVDEIEIDKNGDTVRSYTWKPSGDQGSKTVYGPSQAVAYRMWTPSPGKSGTADSPMRASLDVAEELLVLTQAVMATAVSRTTNPVFLIPTEISPSPAEPDGDEDPQNNPFIADLTRHLVAAKEQAGTAEAAAPFVFEAAYEYLDGVRTVSLHDTANDYAEIGLRKEAVDRLGQGMDFPPEFLRGYGQTNHWAAKQILDDMWRSHGSSVGEQFTDDLNAVYYQPALRDAGFGRWRDVVIGIDDSLITMKSDRSDDARTGIREGAIGPSGWRKMTGTDESFAPSEEEKTWMLELRGKPTGPPAAPEVVNPSQPPPQGPQGDSGRRTRITASAAQEVGAAAFALLRCRELAGNRIRNRDRSCADGREAPLVAASVGSHKLKQMGFEPRTLVAGGTDFLRRLLLDWGHTEAQAQTMCEMVELYAARTLFEENPSLPAGVESQILLMKELAA